MDQYAASKCTHEEHVHKAKLTKVQNPKPKTKQKYTYLQIMKEAEEHKSKTSVDEEWRMREYYRICTLGGMLSAGTTHLLITPLDVLKVNMQVYHNHIPLCVCVYVSAFE